MRSSGHNAADAGLRRRLLVMACLFALAVLALSGCGKSGVSTAASVSPIAARTVAQGSLPADRTRQVALGVHRLGERAWVAWDLAGDADARAGYRLKVERISDGKEQSTELGPATWGPGATAEAVSLEGLQPGRYRIWFKQTVYPDAPGYAVKFTVHTSL